MLFNLWIGLVEFILFPVHLNSQPNMQCHGNTHRSYEIHLQYMLLMCLKQSHSYLISFIKTRGGCVYSESRSVRVDGNSEVIHKWNWLSFTILLIDILVNRNLFFGSSVNRLIWSSDLVFHLSHMIWFLNLPDLFGKSLIGNTVKYTVYATRWEVFSHVWGW